MKWQFQKKLTLLPHNLAALSKRLIFYLLFLWWVFNFPLQPQNPGRGFSCITLQNLLRSPQGLGGDGLCRRGTCWA